MITIEDLKKAFENVKGSFGFTFEVEKWADHVGEFVITDGKGQVVATLDVKNEADVAQHLAMGIAFNQLTGKGVLKFDKRAVYADAVDRMITDAIEKGIVKDEVELGSKMKYNVNSIHMTRKGLVCLSDSFYDVLLSVLGLQWKDYCDYDYVPE